LANAGILTQQCDAKPPDQAASDFLKPGENQRTDLDEKPGQSQLNSFFSKRASTLRRTGKIFGKIWTESFSQKAN
jgi:hypothetical protein